MTAYPKWWPNEWPADELTEGAWEFVGLLRRARIEPDPRLLDWIAAREFERVVWG